MKQIIIITLIAAGAFACAAREKPEMKSQEKPRAVAKTEAEWRKALTPQQYKVLCEEETEPAFTGKYWNNKESGVYRCAACGAPLFSSDEKYESGTGWPSFWAPIEKGAVGEKTDRKLFMVRTEVHCDKCGGHLGHVFNDGPKPTGLRYCINSAALDFEKGETDKP